jgi:YidC/Oxa1 family membrane protein insertase
MMAFFFYKVAAGLALYFIVSTSWGIIERQFIPKPKINLDTPAGGSGGDGGTTADLKPKSGLPNGKPMTQAEAIAAAQQKSKGLLGRLREALQKKLEEMQKHADEQSRRQIINDPNRPGGQQDDQTGGQDGNRRDKKKKRKK